MTVVVVEERNVSCRLHTLIPRTISKHWIRRPCASARVERVLRVCHRFTSSFLSFQKTMSVTQTKKKYTAEEKQKLLANLDLEGKSLDWC